MPIQPTCPRCGPVTSLRGGNKCWFCDQPVTDAHIYISTACLHDRHDYCQSPQGHSSDGFRQVEYDKQPAQCKFCEAPCICECHTEETDGR